MLQKISGRFIAGFIGMFSPVVFSDTLITDNYTVNIERHCAEGEVSCNRVIYRGNSATSGKALVLEGSTLYRMCADGVTPCQFLGYRFENKGVIYIVTESGMLRVMEGDNTLVQEQGQWLR